jgi:predicted dehydrogenase
MGHAFRKAVELAKRALKKSKHIFIEEPLTTNIEKAEILLSMQREADVKVQVGSGMRLNPSVIETNVFKLKPLYIETQYLTEKESELSVVLDLMLRDIDFVLHLIKSEVRKISANSVSLSGVTSDVVNARIEFGNGGVASLTVNRNAKKEIHTASIFENGNAVVLDFNASIMENVPQSAYNLAITKQAEENSNKSTLIGHRAEALKVELQSFFNCIIENKNPLVPLSDACRALKLAYQILDKIEERRMEN